MQTDTIAPRARESMFENGTFGLIVVCSVPASVLFVLLLLAL